MPRARRGAIHLLVAALAAWATLASPAHANEPPPLATYGRLPQFETAALSGSGEHTAAIALIEGNRTLVVFDKANTLLMRQRVGTVKVRSLSWVGDDALMVEFGQTVYLGLDFTTDKAELQSVLIVPLNGEKPWTIFDHHPTVTGGVWGTYGVARRDGRWFGYFGGITQTRTSTGTFLPSGRLEPDLYGVDIQARNSRLLANRAKEDATRRWLVDGAGEVAATLDLNRHDGNWSITGPKHRKLASGVSLLGRVSLIGLSQDGASVIYGVRDAEQRSDDWFSVPLDGGTPQPFLPDTAVRRAFLDAGQRLIGFVDDTAEGRAHFFDPRLEKIYQGIRRAFPGKRLTLIDKSDDFRRLIVTTEGDGDPLVWWTVDIASGAATVLGTSYAVRSENVAPVRMVPYSASDGLAMEGVLTVPPGVPAKGLPAVILPHGGPTAYDTPGFDWIAQAFASRGYAVFQPNFRGSSGYGTAFEMAGHGEWGRKMQTDLSDGLAELVRQGIVDPSRVCIVGGSYGGYAALAGVTIQQGIYRCAVAIAGVSDVARMAATDLAESGHDPLMRRSLRAQVGSGRDLAAISPIRFVDRVNVPVLLIHGNDDTVVSPEQSANMANALRKAGKPVEYVRLPGEDHWLSQSDTRQATLEAAVNFVIKANPPDAPAPR